MSTSKHQISIEKVVSVIQGLALPGIIPQNVLNQDVGDEKDFGSLPGVSVSGFGTENYDPAAGANPVTEAGYPVLIAIIDKKGPEGQSTDTRMLWRATIRNALQHKKWSSGSTYNGQYDTRMEMGPITDGVSWNKLQLWVSILTCRVFWRELHQ